MANFVDTELKEKLIKMEWFRSIGSPKRIVAPMVDASDLAYRMQCRKHGAQLVYTQMFSSHMFVEVCLFVSVPIHILYFLYIDIYNACAYCFTIVGV